MGSRRLEVNPNCFPTYYSGWHQRKHQISSLGVLCEGSHNFAIGRERGYNAENVGTFDNFHIWTPCIKHCDPHSALRNVQSKHRTEIYSWELKILFLIRVPSDFVISSVFELLVCYLYLEHQPLRARLPFTTWPCCPTLRFVYWTWG